MKGVAEAPKMLLAEGRIKGGRLLEPGEKIYDLVDVYDEQGGVAEPGVDVILRSGEKIFDLVDVVEEEDGEPCLSSGLNEEIMERVSKITEKIARDMIPDIAARMVREELERFLKSGYGK